MILKSGHIYFIKDDFFKTINDPYLKINYDKTSRPHYYGIKDENSDLFWLVPCSSKIEKYEKIILKQNKRNKKSLGIKIIKIRNDNVALLFQDMFPISIKYIDQEYIKNGNPYYVSNPKLVDELNKNAKIVKNMLIRGISFTKTQPDVKRIENLMIKENQSFRNKIKFTEEKADEYNMTLDVNPLERDLER